MSLASSDQLGLRLPPIQLPSTTNTNSTPSPTASTSAAAAAAAIFQGTQEEDTEQVELEQCETPKGEEHSTSIFTRCCPHAPRKRKRSSLITINPKTTTTDHQQLIAIDQDQLDRLFLNITVPLHHPPLQIKLAGSKRKRCT